MSQLWHDPEQYYQVSWVQNGNTLHDLFHANQRLSAIQQTRELRELGYRPRMVQVIRGTVERDIYVD